MKKYIQFIMCILNLIGSANWYVNIDQPTFWQRIYKWRISFKTAFNVAKLIWLTKSTITT
jgi:hypothetical protein